MSLFVNKKQKQAYLQSPVFLQSMILFFLAVALYINTIGFDYTLDDTMIITGNEYTNSGVDGIKDIMTSDAMAGYLDNPEDLLPGGRYRPLTKVMFALEYEIWGANPFYGHMINILLYALLGVVLFFLLRLMFKYQYQKPWYLTMPFIVTAFFIAHPIHTEVVANIKGRDEIMAMLGSVGTLWLILRYIDLKEKLFLVFAGIVFFFSLLSKENAVTMLAVAPLMLLVFRRETFKQYVITIIPLIIAFLAYLALRRYALGFWTNEIEDVLLLNDPFKHATLEQRYATVFFTWLIYLKLLFYPYPLTHDYYPYHIELTGFSDPVVILSVIIWTALLLYGLIRIWKRDVVAFGILFFLITFSVSSNLIINVGTFMNERFMFMPSLGFVLIAGWILNQTLRRAIRDRRVYKKLTAALVLFLVLAGSARTVHRNMAWKDDLTLFTTDVQVSKNSTKVNVSAGGKLREAAMEVQDQEKRDSMLRLSEQYLKRGLQIHPRNFQGALLLGQNYLDRQLHDKAYNVYQYILERNPGHAKAYNNMHHLLQKTNAEGETQIAIRAGEYLLEKKPGDHEVRYDLAMAYMKSGNLDKAVRLLQRILDKDPEYAPAYRELGGIFGKHYQDMDSARHYLMKAYELEPSDYSTLQNLGIVFAREGKFQKAINFLEKAVSLEPSKEGAYKNLMVIYKNIGEEEMANKYAAKIRELRQNP
ncbi:MAG: tetratricopeptide repeat protein [Bacteroidales bacterium]